MKRAWLIVLCLMVAAAFATPAAAGKIPGAIACAAPDQTVTVGAVSAPPLQVLATDVNEGFNCNNVHLAVTVNVTPIISTWVVEARSMKIGPNVTIDNNFNNDSDIFLTATGLPVAGLKAIDIATSTIRANDHLILECKAAKCQINIQSSTISSPINPALASGDTRAIGHGDVNILNSTFFGKNKVGVFSSTGNIVWHCGPGGGVCEDPLKSSTAVTACGPDPQNPALPKLPCQITFTTLQQITDFCIKPQPGGICGGGTGECQVNAYLDVDLINSKIECLSHFAIIAKTGSIFADGADLKARDALTLQAFKGVFAPDSKLASTLGTVTLEAKGGIAPPGLCIDVSNANVTKPRVLQAKNLCTVDTTGLTPP